MSRVAKYLRLLSVDERLRLLRLSLVELEAVLVKMAHDFEHERYGL